MNQLSVEMCLLRHMIIWILFSKMRRFDFIFERDITVMFYMLGEHPLNMPALIM